MQLPHMRVRLVRSDAKVLAAACLTFMAVPFSSGKPNFKLDAFPFLDRVFDSILEQRKQLTDPSQDVFLPLIPEEVSLLCTVLESIVNEYANNDMELELHVGTRAEVLACQHALRTMLDADRT